MRCDCCNAEILGVELLAGTAAVTSAWAHKNSSIVIIHIKCVLPESNRYRVQVNVCSRCNNEFNYGAHKAVHHRRRSKFNLICRQQS